MAAEGAASSSSGSTTLNTFDDYNAALQSAVLNATKLSAALPSDINFYRSIDSEFAQVIDECSEKALRLANKLLDLADSKSSESGRTKGKRKLEDEDDVVDNFGSLVIDVLDQLFERADADLDKHFGRIKPAAIEVHERPARFQPPLRGGRGGRLDPSILHASRLAKPQLKFKFKVDNMTDYVWSPSLRHKHNALVPLGYAMQDSDDAATSNSPHPYRYEVQHIKYPQRMFEHKDATPFVPFDSGSWTWVDTRQGLESMLDKLKKVQEIAVDLEHHNYRSFSGFLCLMQISTREEDFIIDTLALRDELEDMNEVFTDPKITKVFHGADNDVIWLQRDFSVYIVNMFDTFHASQILDFPKHSLSALLEMYCDFIPDKRYQLADWRIRPLPDDMLKYAQSDTHFLLYIYDNLRNALLDRASGNPDLVRMVLSRSEETALRTYEREVYDFETGVGPGGWSTLAQRWGRNFMGMNLAVYRAIHAWRDRVAREEDESTHFVFPNHYLFKIAEQPPADIKALLRMFRPVPPLVQSKAASLLEATRAAIKHFMSSSNVHTQKATTSDISAESISSRISIEANSTSVQHNEEKVITDIWSTRPSAIMLASSAFLGIPSVKGITRDLRSSAHSQLFPSSWLNARVRRAQYTASERYSEVAEKIHRALLVPPSVPKILDSPTASSTTVPTVGEKSEPAGPEQIEIPFVPSSHRQQTIMEAEAEKDIVMVGRPKQKRKRTKQQAETREEGEDAGSSKKVKTAQEVDESKTASGSTAFDYESFPNILDDPRESSRGLPFTRFSRVLKGSKKKGPKIEYGDFPKPPKAHSEIKSGNKTHTFRS